MHETGNLRFFWGANFELEFKFKKFKMADPIWWIKFAKYNSICMKFGIWEFFGVLISN